MTNKSKFPRVPYAFFKWYCRRDRFEELHGDLEELFYEREAENGRLLARIQYTMDVICCCQSYAWNIPKRKPTSINMVRNYYKTSMRSLIKNPLNSFINFFGLAAAVGVCILAYAFAQWTYKTDQFHHHKHEVYLLTFFADLDGKLQQHGQTPMPIGDMLKQDFDQLKSVCRIEDKPIIVKKEGHIFHENVRFTDPSFLQMFTFPLKWGSPNSLVDVNSIVLSEDAAVKYFGKSNPVGKELKLIFGKNNSKNFKVTGVANPFPSARTIDFDYLINYENLKIFDGDFNPNDWNNFIDATFVQVSKSANIEAIRENMGGYIDVQNKADDDWQISSFAFEELADLHLNAGDIKSNVSYSSEDNLSSIVFLSIIGLFLLVLACINYVNIAVVSAAKRLKEIAVRKSIGATRKTIIFQFLTENMVVMFFALTLGVILGLGVFIPWFENMNNFSMEFYIWDTFIWLFLPAMLVFTGFFSGIYPALYISRHRVVTIFKGSVKFGRQNPLTKIFLGVQLVLACVFIACAVMFTRNTTYIANRSWGYDQQHVLYASIPDKPGFDQLKATMAQYPDVLEIAGSSHHLGRNNVNALIQLPDRKYEVDKLTVDANYFETLGLRLKNGRLFDDQNDSDKEAVIVNEQLVRNLGAMAQVGQEFKIDSIDYRIIGIVEDFHFANFSVKVKPTIFTLTNEQDYGYLSLRVKSGHENEIYKSLHTEWSAQYPEIPFQGGHQEDVWGSYFEVINTHGKFWRGMASIAVILAGLGLYGLVTLNVVGRTKEFSIRKIMGAKLNHIANQIVKQYVVLFLIATLVGAPASYFMVKFIFEIAYPYHMPMDYYGIIISICILAFVLLVTVANQIRRVASSSPIKAINDE